MSSGLHPTGKNLYQLTQLGPTIGNLMGFARNSLRFIEVMKIMFQQKGYVSSGLNANVTLKKVKIEFKDDLSAFEQPKQHCDNC